MNYRKLIGTSVVVFQALIITFLVATANAGPSSGTGRHVLHGHVPKAVARLQAVGRLPKTKRLNIVIGLPLRNQSDLNSLVQQLYDPNSPQYHKFLTPEQFTARFGPTESDYNAVKAFAKTNGLTVVRTHHNRTLLNVNGSVADIERVFHVALKVYNHPTEARTFYAPDTEPSVDLDTPLLTIGGLNNYQPPRPAASKRPLGSKRPAGAAALTGTAPYGYFMGSDFRKAYIPGSSLAGSGQTIGLFELDGYYTNDIASYESLAGLPAVPMTNVLLDGSTGIPDIYNFEVALDIEMAISMAPGLDKVVVYEGGDPDGILNEMANPSQGEPLSMQLSASWLYQVDASSEQIFQQFAAQGQSYFTASGDSDAYPPNSLTGELLWDSMRDINVTVVGGTTLATGSGGSWQSETAWNWGDGLGTSGGTTAFDIPLWQQGVIASTNQGSPFLRNIPDVALTADDVWVTHDDGESSAYGGTSCATPLWAAFTALINQQAATYGKPPIGFLNPAVYALSRSSIYTNCFHDITTGNSTNSYSPNAYYSVAGYDLCTGLGTPNGTNLIYALASPGWLMVSPVGGFIFNGSPGGPFSVSSENMTLTNTGTSSLNWTLTNTAAWLDISTNAGTLASGGVSTVTVSLNSTADSLTPGTYTAAIWVTNLTDSTVQGCFFTLYLLGAPTVIIQPQGQPLLVGDTTDISVTVVGAAPLSYSWQRNGIPIPGATNDSYSLDPVQMPDSGSQIDCVISNAYGAITSSVVTLAVFPAPWYTFDGTNNAEPLASLVLGPNGNLYGTTSSGGSYGDGAVFEVTTNDVLTNIVSFDGTNNGFSPGSPLILGNDGDFYGTANGGYGTVFKMTPDGSLTTLVAFGGTNGAGYYISLVQGNDGYIYGVTSSGGDYYDGTVFKMDTNGLLTTLVSFDGTNGASPVGGIVQGSDGNFYGTTSSGGAYGGGTVFKMTSGGSLTTLVSFDGANGSGPMAGMIRGNDGNLYGATMGDDVDNYGTIFKITTNGVLTTLFFFNGTNGSGPESALMQASDGNFYGTTEQGGTYNDGTVFEMSPAGSLITLFPFAGVNGADPYGSALIQLSDGTFYGTTSTGGTHDVGTLFRFGGPLPEITYPAHPVTMGDTATFSINDEFLAYQWLYNGEAISGATNATLTLSGVRAGDAGLYSVVVTTLTGTMVSSLMRLDVWSPGYVSAWGGDSAGQTDVPAGLSNVVAVAAGDYNSLALQADGTLVGWGDDGSGLLDFPAGLSNVVAIANGVDHSLALKSDGTVVAWGYDGNGETNVPAGLSNVVSIAAGGAHSLALKTDGSVIGWGDDSHGQIDIPAGLSNVVGIASGWYHSAALKRDGTVVGWGYDGYGETNTPAGLSNVVNIAVGAYYTLALKTDGTVVGWGDDSYGQLDAPAGLSNVVAITTGWYHSVALKNDGTVVAWGYDGNGQTNVPADLIGVTAISAGAGGYHTLAISPVKILAWPQNQTAAAGGDATFTVTAISAEPAVGFAYQWLYNGQAIIGATNATLTLSGVQAGDAGMYSVEIITGVGATISPLARLDVWSPGYVWAWGADWDGQADVPAGLSNVVAVSGGDSHSLVLQNDGTITGWGDDSYGQIDIPSGLSDVMAISAGGWHNLALQEDGTVVAWGSDIYGETDVPAGLTNVVSIATGWSHSLALRNDGTVVGWGYDDDGEIDVPAGLNNVVAIAANGWHSMALKSDGTVVGWGANWSGQTNTPAGLSNVVAIAAGAYHSLALKADGTVVGWGDDSLGSVDIPVGLSNVVAIAANGAFSYALKSDGTMVGWGDDSEGQTDIPAGLSNVVAAAGGWGHGLAISLEGYTVPPQGQTVYAGGTVTFAAPAAGTMATYQWQYNGQAIAGATNALLTLGGVQVGDAGLYSVVVTTWAGTTVSPLARLDVWSPGYVWAWGADWSGQTDVPAGLSNVVAVAGGDYNSLALKNDGTVLGWGDDSSGAIDIPAGLSNVVAIVGGDDQSLALKEDGTVVGWGGDWGGDIDIPAGLSNVVGIAAGEYYSLALKSDGTVLGWGNNDYGQTNIPAGLSNVVAIAAGWDHNLALKGDGTVVGWGDDYYGESDIPAGLSNVVNVAVGAYYSLALKNDGTVVGWGADDSGQTNIPAGLTNVVAITAGWFHALALKNDGTVVGWGGDSYGQLDIPAGLTGVTAISAGAGSYHSLALRSP